MLIKIIVWRDMYSKQIALEDMMIMLFAWEGMYIK